MARRDKEEQPWPLVDKPMRPTKWGSGFPLRSATTLLPSSFSSFSSPSPLPHHHPRQKPVSVAALIIPSVWGGEKKKGDESVHGWKKLGFNLSCRLSLPLPVHGVDRFLREEWGRGREGNRWGNRKPIWRAQVEARLWTGSIESVYPSQCPHSDLME